MNMNYVCVENVEGGTDGLQGSRPEALAGEPLRGLGGEPLREQLRRLFADVGLL